MSDRVYFNPDGTPKREALGREQAARDASAERRGVDPGLIASLLEELHDRGYVVLRDLVPRETMAGIKAAALPYLTHDGRNEIEGYRTRRIYSVIQNILACNPLVEHPLVLALLDQLLLPNYLLSQLQVIDIHPGRSRSPSITTTASIPSLARAEPSARRPSGRRRFHGGERRHAGPAGEPPVGRPCSDRRRQA